MQFCEQRLEGVRVKCCPKTKANGDTYAIIRVKLYLIFTRHNMRPKDGLPGDKNCADGMAAWGNCAGYFMCTEMLSAALAAWRCCWERGMQ